MFISLLFRYNRVTVSWSRVWWDMAALWAGTKVSHSPAQGCCSASVSKCGSMQLWKEQENKDERIQNHFAISVTSPFPLFFSLMAFPPLIKQSLPSLWWPFTVLPIISLLSTSVGSVSTVLESCWCLTALPAAVFWSHTSVPSPASQSPCRRTQAIKCPSLELSMLIPSPGHSYLGNNKKWANM